MKNIKNFKCAHWKNTAIAKLIISVFVLLLMNARAFAYTDAVSSNSVSALTVRITPNVDRGVEISSGDVNLDMGNLDLNASTYTVKPATITILGTISTTELTLSAAITGGWSFDSTPNTAESDKIAVWPLFTGVNFSSVPLSTDFEIYNATIASDTSSQSATDVGDASGRYEGGWSGSDMDALAPGASRHLWVRMRSPSATTVTTEQTIMIELAVEPED